jgi:hypothetical protein
MKQLLVLKKVLLLSLALIVVTPGVSTFAQHGHGNPVSGEGIHGKKVKQKKIKEKKTITRGKAGKAVRAQAKKAKERERKNAKADRKLKDHHFEIQSKSTQERMVNNNKKTQESYKAKRQKIKKESRQPKNHSRP